MTLLLKSSTKQALQAYLPKLHLAKPLAGQVLMMTVLMGVFAIWLMPTPPKVASLSLLAT
jgi:hypothetical protein